MSYKRWWVFGCAVVVGGLGLGAAAVAAEVGERGWTVEAGLGESSLERVFGQRWPKAFDADDQAWSGEVGYRVNRYLTIQGGIHDVGSFGGFGSPCTEDAELCVDSLVMEEALAICVEGATDPICRSFAPVPLTADVSGVSLSVLPRWPVTERFAVRGRVGLLDWEADISPLFWNRTTERFSGQDEIFGIGLQYELRSGLGLLVERRDSGLDAASTLVGAGWRF